MQVFMHNVPERLADESVTSQLRPSMAELGIQDWSCRKLGKKRFVTIDFLSKSDGRKFLLRYEQRPLCTVDRTGRPQFEARFTMLGTQIYCMESEKLPDDFSLMNLAKLKADRSEAQRQNYEMAPDKVVFQTRSLSCGTYRYIGQDLSYLPEITWETWNGSVKFLKDTLVIAFADGLRTMKVEIPYRIVEAIFISRSPFTLTLTLWEAPKFFESDSPSNSGALGHLFALLDSIHPSAKIKTPQKTRITALPHTTKKQDRVLGQALVYQIAVSSVGFEEKVRAISHRQNLVTFPYNFSDSQLAHEMSLEDQLTSYDEAIATRGQVIPFGVLYQLDCLVKNAFLLPLAAEEVLDLMLESSEKSVSNARVLNMSAMDHGPLGTRREQVISAAAVRRLLSQMPFPSPDIHASTFDPHEIWEFLKINEKDLGAGRINPLLPTGERSDIVMVYKANVTPTRITLHGPEPEAQNRILRRFPNHSEVFLRVQFCDEDGSDLQFNSSVSNEKIYDRFRTIFKKGIHICGRHFNFLGFSASSLRSHSAWFMAPFVHENELQTYFSVISYIGEFGQIFCPARCAARIGQAFSETPLAISLKDNGISHREVQDVISQDKSRVFSDGVGLISQLALEEVHKSLPRQRSYPTCFQIRWGAAKGMLSLHTPLKDKEIWFRPSMVKFESKDTANLEICDMGRRPIQMVLNRQMIKILEDMGVSHSWFLERQSQAIDRLSSITAHMDQTVKFLQRQKVADSIGFPKFIRRLDEIGTSYKLDRFLASVVETLILHELRLLKHKARIPVADGVTLFGVMDETRYLNENEIFVTFEPSIYLDAHSSELTNQTVIVTRSPALHPGDIQLATNIVPPDHHPLRSLQNCIVFSQRGERDLPSCLSGGDLDGDLYNIIWDQVAVDQCTQIYEPADYERTEPLNIDRPVQASDMTDFFVEFMATDHLGLIAVRHMIFADQKPAGTVDDDCKKLAELHSTGVDYPKTGISIDLNQLKQIKANRYRPDFLALAPQANLLDGTKIVFDAPTAPAAMADDEDEDPGPVYQYYESKKILGELYRNIDEKQIWYRDVKNPDQQNENIWDRFLDHIRAEYGDYVEHIPTSKPVIDEAWSIRHAYEDAIADARHNFSDNTGKPITELEVFTGHIFNRGGAQTRRQRDRSIKLKDEFDRIARWAAAMVRKRDSRDIEEGEDKDEDKKAQSSNVGSDAGLTLSLACLHVSRQKDKTRRSEGRSGGAYDSFKVVSACCVMKELDAAAWRRREEEESMDGPGSMKIKVTLRERPTRVVPLRQPAAG